MGNVSPSKGDSLGSIPYLAPMGNSR